MTERPEKARAQAPGIGGPVDLAGIARYWKVRRWAVAAFTLAAVGAAALLALWVPDAPIWLQATLIVLSGYAVSTPPALGATWLARRRRKRLEAAGTEEKPA